MTASMAEPDTPPSVPTAVSSARSKAARRAARAASGRLGPFGWLYLGVLGVFFFVPLLAMARFAFQRFSMAIMTWDKVFDGWSLSPLTDAFTNGTTLDMVWVSVKLAILTVALTIALVLPTALFVDLKAPALRAVLMVLTIAPWIVPPIALVVGVTPTFRASARWFLSSIYCLVPFYTLWALPFAYRAIDGGLRAINVRTLYEASRSLGASTSTFLFKVVLPNMVPALLVTSALTSATVLGEFAFAQLLGKQTLPTYLIVISGSSGNPRQGMALSLASLMLTTIVIGLAAAGLRRRGISFNAAGI